MLLDIDIHHLGDIAVKITYLSSPLPSLLSLELLLGRPLQQVEGSKPLLPDATTADPDGTTHAMPNLATLDRPAIWRALLIRGAPLTQTGVATNTGLNNNSPLSGGEDAEPKRRGRRQTNSGSRGHHAHHGHPQLMRVGCVLGTCQVQNLSHRLYQLIGQSGRDDSSPINPRSPHSYG